MKNEKVIIAGDFDSNVIWDKLKRKVSHSTVVEKLATMNISSTYHKYVNSLQGVEEHPTCFMYRHCARPYHIDYCFASAGLIDKLENVEVGTHEEWKGVSDHSLLIVSFRV